MWKRNEREIRKGNKKVLPLFRNNQVVRNATKHLKNKKEMKKIINLVAIVLFTSSVFGQISLEHSYPNGKWETSIAKLSNSGMKYLWVDVSTGVLKLYNLDHTLFKTLTFPVLANMTNVEVGYLSETTFDLDADVEFMVYYQDDNNWANSVTKIIDESGTTILNAVGETPSINTYDGIHGAIFNTPNGTKMILDNHTDNAAKVYSLPGTLIATAINDIEYDENFLESYPNPAGNYIKLAYTLPTNIKEAKVSIYDIEGKIVKSYTIDNNYKDLFIDTQDFSNGTYLCQINSNGIAISDTKFIVQK